MSAKFEILKARVLVASSSQVWEEAVMEWSLTNFAIDPSAGAVCVCSQQGLKYLHEITNQKTGRSLFPIGSRCIAHFGREDLEREVVLRDAMMKLWEKLDVVPKGHSIDIGLFSRKLLAYFFQKGAFQPSKYNGNGPHKDYRFMVDMFNKVDRDAITLKQQRKIDVLTRRQIRPFIAKHFKSKRYASDHTQCCLDRVATSKNSRAEKTMWPSLVP